MMNQYYLDNNLRLNELFDKISQIIEELDSEEKQTNRVCILCKFMVFFSKK